MDYEKSVGFSGDPKKAVELAQSVFVQAGYRIVQVSDTRISARQEGEFVKSISSSTLYGASPVSVEVSSDRLIVKAGYQGIEKTKSFLLKLFIGLGLFLGIALGGVFALVFDDKKPALFGLAMGAGIPLIQLPIHLLVTPRTMKKRATAALETLIQNIATLAR